MIISYGLAYGHDCAAVFECYRPLKLRDRDILDLEIDSIAGITTGAPMHPWDLFLGSFEAPNEKGAQISLLCRVRVNARNKSWICRFADPVRPRSFDSEQDDLKLSNLVLRRVPISDDGLKPLSMKRKSLFLRASDRISRTSAARNPRRFKCYI
jgi:hypothetical protein